RRVRLAQLIQEVLRRGVDKPCPRPGNGFEIHFSRMEEKLAGVEDFQNRRRARAIQLFRLRIRQQPAPAAARPLAGWKVVRLLGTDVDRISGYALRNQTVEFLDLALLA